VRIGVPGGSHGDGKTRTGRRTRSTMVLLRARPVQNGGMEAGPWRQHPQWPRAGGRADALWRANHPAAQGARRGDRNPTARRSQPASPAAQSGMVFHGGRDFNRFPTEPPAGAHMASRPGRPGPCFGLVGGGIERSHGSGSPAPRASGPDTPDCPRPAAIGIRAQGQRDGPTRASKARAHFQRAETQSGARHTTVTRCGRRRREGVKCLIPQKNDRPRSGNRAGAWTARRSQAASRSGATSSPNGTRVFTGKQGQKIAAEVLRPGKPRLVRRIR